MAARHVQCASSMGFVCLLFACLASSVLSTEDNKNVKARLEVKAFINDDSANYPDLEVRYIGGIDPRMIFLKDGEETERVDIAEKSRDEINQLLNSHGLTQMAEPEGEEEADENTEKNEEQLEDEHKKLGEEFKEGEEATEQERMEL